MLKGVNVQRCKKNREIGKTVVPLKEYFRKSAADFEKKEIENKKVKKNENLYYHYAREN